MFLTISNTDGGGHLTIFNREGGGTYEFGIARGGELLLLNTEVGA